MIAISPVAHDIIIFGRGSEPGPDGSRLLSDMGKLRVDAAAEYISQNTALFSRAIRIQFSGGWAAGEGLDRPADQYLEANMGGQYAESIGLPEIPNVDSTFNLIHTRLRVTQYTVRGVVFLEAVRLRIRTIIRSALWLSVILTMIRLGINLMVTCSVA